MAGSVLLKGSIFLVLVLLIVSGSLAKERSKSRSSKSGRDKCRQELSNCVRGGVACQGGGYDIKCIPFERLCDGIADCSWGEDEIYCAPPIPPVPSRFSTRTVIRTTTTTRTSTTTSTRTSTSTSTLTSTSMSSSTSTMSTTFTPTFTLAPSSVWATSVVVTTLPAKMVATRANPNGIVVGGFTCSLGAVAPADPILAADRFIVSVSSTVTFSGSVTASCSPTTTTIW
ncbi:integumentary mucin C.1-like [Ruditapes philippinarum]|uniref:integumentary mucin C.1-like n=1 Tax=Ruditapes philippinarum TaxID=129788 RepID=UPI00295B5189|nr:integumentary mucin C.1-like [Ruditapes philippinarum]